MRLHMVLCAMLGEDITKEDLDYTLEQIKEIVGRLRKLSPLYEDFVRKQKNSKN